MVAVPAIAGAQTQTSGGGSTQTSGGGVSQTSGGIQNPLGQVTGLCQLMKIVLNIALLLGVPAMMFFLVWAGARLVIARGAPEKLASAKWGLTYTLIGIGIFFSVWTFVNILANSLSGLGVQILGDCRP